ncbi:PQQ-binding-like beta-propeller repeat protein [Plebeiibacterium sediminum]|uniref:Uncharacterized protein n=1 Tax=Plebeiibacterium sediminum TaxID=2992112 RepID=A0AAE3SHB9_9BACT|nr:PQQ-binding-like beta-propeller repeat protein [Plebeiobacterium sediminum]MCW3789241.1 hypothetical protein [Plebeiobacterium sediminum]
MIRNNFLPLLYVLVIAVIVTSCNKDDIKALITESNATVIQLNSSDYDPIGVPIVLDNDDFIITYSSADNPYEVIIHRYNRKGEIKWTSKVEEIPACPILYNDQIYFACANYLYALSADDGSLKWKYKLTNEGVDLTKIIYKPCINSEGNIVVCRDSYLFDYDTAVPAKMVCVTPRGTLKWENIFYAEDAIDNRYTKMAAPIATSNGIYCIVQYSEHNKLMSYIKRINATDGHLIAYNLFSDYYGCRLHCTNNNGDVFMSGNDDLNQETLFYSLTASLGTKWKKSFGDNPLVSRAVIDNGGNVYVGVADGYLHKFSSLGNEIYASNLERIFVGGEMLIANDGNIYKGVINPEKIDVNTGQSTTIPLNSVSVSDISMLSDGTIICAGMDELYLVPTSGKGISTSAQWASFGANPGNTSFHE